MAGEDLPVYGDSAPSGLVVSPTERPATTLHVFTYDVPSSKDSCLLKFASRAVTPLAAPVFFEGDVITGTVELKLAKKSAFKGVDIRVMNVALRCMFSISHRYDSLGVSPRLLHSRDFSLTWQALISFTYRES